MACRFAHKGCLVLPAVLDGQPFTRPGKEEELVRAGQSEHRKCAADEAVEFWPGCGVHGICAGQPWGISNSHDAAGPGQSFRSFAQSQLAIRVDNDSSPKSLRHQRKDAPALGLPWLNWCLAVQQMEQVSKARPANRCSPRPRWCGELLAHGLSFVAGASSI